MKTLLMPALLPHAKIVEPAKTKAIYLNVGALVVLMEFFVKTILMIVKITNARMMQHVLI